MRWSGTPARSSQKHSRRSQSAVAALLPAVTGAIAKSPPAQWLMGQRFNIDPKVVVRTCHGPACRKYTPIRLP